MFSYIGDEDKERRDATVFKADSVVLEFYEKKGTPGFVRPYPKQWVRRDPHCELLSYQQKK